MGDKALVLNGALLMDLVRLFTLLISLECKGSPRGAGAGHMRARTMRKAVSSEKIISLSPRLC